jgi:carbamoylphosphate synthase large subunit
MPKDADAGYTIAIRDNGTNLAGVMGAHKLFDGDSAKNIDLAEDREKFGNILKKLNVVCPQYGTGRTLDEVLAVADRIGFPLLARPSYVLGGRFRYPLRNTGP